MLIYMLYIWKYTAFFRTQSIATKDTLTVLMRKISLWILCKENQLEEKNPTYTSNWSHLNQTHLFTNIITHYMNWRSYLQGLLITLERNNGLLKSLAQNNTFEMLEGDFKDFYMTGSSKTYCFSPATGPTSIVPCFALKLCFLNPSNRWGGTTK